MSDIEMDDDEPDDGDEWEDGEECGLGEDGQCTLAGTEHCDFSCSMRDSELFAGSKAWDAKHPVRKPKRPAKKEDPQWLIEWKNLPRPKP